MSVTEMSFSPQDLTDGRCPSCGGQCAVVKDDARTAFSINIFMNRQCLTIKKHSTNNNPHRKFAV